MPPAVPKYTGPDATRKWQEIESAQLAARLTAEDMAGLLGFKTASAYRGWKAKDPPQIPIEQWERFVAIRDTLRDYETRLEEALAATAEAQRKMQEALEFGQGALRAILKIRQEFEGIIGVSRQRIGPLHYRGEPRVCAWKGCSVEFIPRSGTQLYCNRDWHLSQRRSSNEESRESTTPG